MIEERAFNGLSEEFLEIAYAKNWFRLFVKKELGGAETSLPEAMQALFDAAHLDGSLGWCVNLGSGASYFSGFLKPDVALELLGDPKSVFAGSGQIGKAIQTGDHYVISGSWPRCTGAVHATSFTANAELKDGSVRSFVLPRDQVKISNTWTLMGLERSSTYQIDAADVEIPLDHSFEIGSLNAESAYSIHLIPFEPFARCCMIASLLGMTGCFIDKVDADSGLRERTGIQKELAELKMTIAESFQHFQQHAHQLEKCCNSETDASKVVEQICNDVINIAALIREKINAIYYLGGLQIADTKNPANSAFKDLLVAGQHNLFR